MLSKTGATTEVRIGQIWREDDSRQERYVRVDAIEGERVRIRSVARSDAGEWRADSRVGRWASLKRFGKSGGYRFEATLPRQ
jgi:hypothetical protein